MVHDTQNSSQLNKSALTAHLAVIITRLDSILSSLKDAIAELKALREEKGPVDELERDELESEIAEEGKEKDKVDIEPEGRNFKESEITVEAKEVEDDYRLFMAVGCEEGDQVGITCFLNSGCSNHTNDNIIFPLEVGQKKRRVVKKKKQNNHAFTVVEKTEQEMGEKTKQNNAFAAAKKNTTAEKNEQELTVKKKQNNAFADAEKKRQNNIFVATEMDYSPLWHLRFGVRGILLLGGTLITYLDVLLQLPGCHNDLPNKSGVTQSWVFDTGQQTFPRATSFRLEDKSFLQAGSIDTTPELGQSCFGSGQTQLFLGGGKEKHKSGSGEG